MYSPLHAAFTLGFNQTSYSFDEDQSGPVCVVIEQGGIERTQGVDFSITFADGTATGVLISLFQHISMVTYPMQRQTQTTVQVFRQYCSPLTRIHHQKGCALISP